MSCLGLVVSVCAYRALCLPIAGTVLATWMCLLGVLCRSAQHGEYQACMGSTKHACRRLSGVVGCQVLRTARHGAGSAGQTPMSNCRWLPAETVPEIAGFGVGDSALDLADDVGAVF